MDNQEFQKLYKSLNFAQKKAVDQIEGAVMVVAGPGTGKTQVLTLRIANILLKTQVNPENILALTFTEAAAYEMRKRLLSIIGHNAYRVEITTFHSFCNNFIKNNHEEFAHLISSDSINEIDQLKIIKEIIEESDLKMLRPLGDPDYYLKPTMSAINDLKRENVTPNEFQNGLLSFKKNLDKNPDLLHEKGVYKGKMKSIYQKLYKDHEKNLELLNVFENYQKKLKSDKKYDYNDMLLEVIEKLTTHPYLLQYLQEKFQYFLVDEHQDTNSAQNKIIELLCSYYDNPNLFVVGDEKQAIFRFQGANLENFLYFKELYPQASLINLSENYRSTQTILDATYSMILNNPKSTQILSESAGLTKKSQHDEEKIVIAEFKTNDNEAVYIAEKIKELLLKTKAENIAVLARYNRDIDVLVSVFEDYSIPYVIESDSNILDDLDIQKLILIFRLIIDPISNKSEYIKKVMLFSCFEIKPLDVIKLERESYESKISIWDLLQNKNHLDRLLIEDQDKIEHFLKFFIDEKNGVIKKASNERFDHVFVDVLNRSGLMSKILEKSNAQEILARFSRLYDEVKEEVGKNSSYSVMDFIDYIDLLETQDISLKQNSRIIPDGVIRLMTVHKSKGLEFDYVFVINAYDTHFGNSKKRGTLFNIPWKELNLLIDKDLEDDKNIDERRLFYVALTRARKNVFLTYSISSIDGKEQIPSQFISEIPEKYIVLEDVSNLEKDLLLHREKLLKNVNTNKQKSGVSFAKEYVAEVFRRQGLSVSALNNYLECPWKFFFINLIRIPESIDDSGLFGNAIHAALSSCIISLKKGNASKKLLIDRFKFELSLQPITSVSMPRFLERGEKALAGYYQERMLEWNKDLETELDIKGIRINDDLILNGKIDMIKPIKNNIVDVYDFKTGKPKSLSEITGEAKKSNGNYKRQLVFYKILLDRYKSGVMQMRNGVIEFIEPNDNDIFKSESLSVGKDESEELLKNVIEVGKEIINFSFWDKSCDDKDCRFCKLRSFMN